MEHPFNKIIDLLFLARQKGVEVMLNNERLQLKTGENVEIDEQLLNEIRSNKQSIIDYLSSDDWKAVSVNNNQKKITAFDGSSIKHIPASFSQERLWFIDHLGGSVEYHSPTVLRLTGNLDKDALSFSLKTIVGRHEVLRTVFYEIDGQVYQSVKENSSWKLELADGSAYENNADELKLYIEKLVKKPFDLANDFLIRGTLINLNAQENILVVTIHHIASDAWSTGIIINEVVELYSSYTQNRDAKLDTLPLQYADFSVWQRNYLQGDVLNKRIAYWKNKLEGQQTLQLSTDYIRSAVQNSYGASSSFSIDKKLAAKLHDLSQKEGASLYMILLATFKVLLSRYSGQQDITVGTSIASRQQKELEGMIGFFVNTLALRDEIIPGASFTELLQQVKATTLGAYEHQDIPFEKVVEVAVTERDPERTPLFQVMLVLSNTPESSRLVLGDVELRQESFETHISKFEITFFITETPNGMFGHVDYRKDLYTASTISAMLSHYINLLGSVVANPYQKVGKLQMLSSQEEHQLLQEFNNGNVVYPKDKNVVDLFEEQAAKNPAAAAVVFEDEILTYQQLNERSNQLAHYLTSRGVRPNTLIPLYMERSALMMVGMLGILKAGAAYVPIDTDFPDDRISYMLEDADAKIVVSSSTISRQLHAGAGVEIVETDTVSNQSVENVAARLLPYHLAYVIYTSGSTGRPKGVMIEHRHLVDYYYGLNKSIQIDQCSSFALVSTIATDLGNTVIYGSLLSGGALHIFSKESVSNIEYLHRYFREKEIDCLKIVPLHWKSLRDGNLLLLPKKLLVFGGESLPYEVAEEIYATGTACRVVNHYGPTETTIGKLLHKIEPQKKYDKTIPVGRPFSNTKVYVLSKEMQLCPPGIPGQLYISGDGVARGYHNNEELTREKFIDDSFSPASESEARMYATGDLVKWLPDGNIYFIGRVDHQVKIRGYRVEPGEIEGVLHQSGLVSEAVVLAKQDKQGNNRLIAYIVSEGIFDREAIAAYLREKLAEYMIPALIMEVAKMPLTANGKTDRKALPDPDASELSVNEYVAPRNDTELKMEAIWANVLEVEEIGVHDDFFALGGHSLLAVRLVSAIRKAFEVEMPIGHIFDYPTVAALSAQLSGQSDTAVLPVIDVANPKPEYIPLSFSQERLWFIDQMGGSVQYHVPAVLRLTGQVNKAAISFALQNIVRRHEVLRTVYRQHDGQPYQLIIDEAGWKMTEVDGQEYLIDRDGLQNRIGQLIKKPYHLSEDYMLRATLIYLHDEEQVLVVTLHHIASDGWSKSILVNDFAVFYLAFEQGILPQLPALTVQYSDYAIWQRNHLAGIMLEKKISYWKELLQNVSALQLPTDYPRPAIQSTRGAVARFRIDKELSGQLHLISQQQGATLFMTLLAVFKVLLYRYSGQTDICVGTPIAGRQQQEVEGLIGFFVNTLALRTEIDGSTSFKDLLQLVRAGTLAAYENQEAPFEKVVEAVVKERDLSRSPLFQVMFVLRNTPEISGVVMKDVNVAGSGYMHTTALFDMTMFVTEFEHGLEGSLEYNTDLFSEATISRLLAHFTQLLRSATEAPQQNLSLLPMLSSAEETQLLIEFNDTRQDDLAHKAIVGLFEEQVLKSPQATAVVFEKEQLTYSELNTQANQLANYLRSKGIKEQMVVPLSVERSIEMIICVLAILKTGAAYVPIDPEYPEERIRYILRDIGAAVIISSKENIILLAATNNYEVINPQKDRLAISKESTDNLQTLPDADDLVYILYTSGSTGNPKGVEMPGRALVNLLNWQQKQFTNHHRRVLQFASLNFDVSFQEIFSTLCFGSRLYLISADRRKEIAELLSDIYDYRITHLFIPYIILKNLSEYIVSLSPDGFSLQEIIVAGEQLKITDDIKELISNFKIRLINQYGPTEAHVVSSYIIDAGNDDLFDLPPIGKPIDNSFLYVLGDQQQLVPIGVTGELYIGGVQVAKGYLNLPDSTAERFINDPFSKEPGKKMYKTGDLARWLPDGNLAYLGRADDQVKVRGYRIEPGEIEAVLQASDLISQAVVIAKEDSKGNKNLVGYIVPAGIFDQQTLVSYLKSKLPDYMVPAVWVVMERLPITSNGKVDRKALPDAETSLQSVTQHIAPRNELEAKLVELWQELLGLKNVSIYDNFFDLGGHSLYAIRLVWQIRKQMNLSIRVNDVFIHPTIAGLAGNIIDKVQNPSLPAVNIKYLVPAKTAGSKQPLYFVAGGGGTALKIKKFADLLHIEQPVYVFQPPFGDDDLRELPDTIEGIARIFIEELLIQNPEGPYALSGHCIGGIIAFEMAKQLKAMGKIIHSLTMFDTIIRKKTTPQPATLKNLYHVPQIIQRSFSKLMLKVDFQTFLLRKHTLQSIRYKVNNFRLMRDRNKRKKFKTSNLENAGLEIFNESSDVYIAACRNYKLEPYNGEIILFYATERYFFYDRIRNISYKKLYLDEKTKNNWKEYAAGISIYEIKGEHSDIFDPIHGGEFADTLQKHLNQS